MGSYKCYCCVITVLAEVRSKVANASESGMRLRPLHRGPETKSQCPGVSSGLLKHDREACSHHLGLRKVRGNTCFDCATKQQKAAATVFQGGEVRRRHMEISQQPNRRGSSVEKNGLLLKQMPHVGERFAFDSTPFCCSFP